MKHEFHPNRTNYSSLGLRIRTNLNSPLGAIVILLTAAAIIFVLGLWAGIHAQQSTTPPVLLPDPVALVLGPEPVHVEVIGRCAAQAEFDRLTQKARSTETFTKDDERRYAALWIALSTVSTLPTPEAPNGAKVDTSALTRTRCRTEAQ